jgi:hypothetical protein
MWRGVEQKSSLKVTLFNLTLVEHTILLALGVGFFWFFLNTKRLSLPYLHVRAGFPVTCVLVKLISISNSCKQSGLTL